jgi:hypothetical protein
VGVELLEDFRTDVFVGRLRANRTGRYHLDVGSKQ